MVIFYEMCLIYFIKSILSIYFIRYKKYKAQVVNMISFT
jgi:hypothetical protein